MRFFIPKLCALSWILSGLAQAQVERVEIWRGEMNFCETPLGHAGVSVWEPKNKSTAIADEVKSRSRVWFKGPFQQLTLPEYLDIHEVPVVAADHDSRAVYGVWSMFPAHDATGNHIVGIWVQQSLIGAPYKLNGQAQRVLLNFQALGLQSPPETVRIRFMQPTLTPIRMQEGALNFQSSRAVLLEFGYPPLRRYPRRMDQTLIYFLDATPYKPFTSVYVESRHY
jgi:hypothetical protein